MIRRLFIAGALCAVLGGQAPASWQSVQQINVGAAPAGYTGPGDIVASAAMWWGLRGYTTAFSGAVANVCDSATGLTCADATWAAGTLTLPTIGGSACNNIGNICKVKTLYDQTGNGFHATDSGGGVATWPTLTLSCIGSLPCMTHVSANTTCLKTAGSLSQVAPSSLEFVAKKTGAGTAQRVISLASGVNTRASGFNTANTVGMVSPALTVAAADSAFHAVQIALNGASTVVSADGTGGSGSITGTIASSTVGFGGNQACSAGSANLDGQTTEGGAWPGAFSAQNIIDLNSNAHTYWGF